MCGIAGLFSKSPATAARLGELLARMLIELAERGPDSVGVAIYRDPAPPGTEKLTLHSPAAVDWVALSRELPALEIRPHGRHAVLITECGAEQIESKLAVIAPHIDVVSAGALIEIYKQAGAVSAVLQDIGVRSFSGSHAIGHTRMATESVVTTEHAHPFSTGLDLCLVHNGSLSNHNRLRARLRADGVRFRTDNDSEVAAGYLTWRLAQGASLEQALEGCLEDLDGFFTFAVGTADGFAVLRDPIACKPAVMAETDDWVAMASEYRAIATLPGAAGARVWEPAPGRVYHWGAVLA
jgi:glutamate synthase domain-containing protein 1